MLKLTADKRNRWIASKKWYVTALTLILWATLQEIVMESTDLVDNFFANNITGFKDQDFLDFNTFLLSVFTPSLTNNVALMQHWGLGNYINYHYTAGQLAMNGVAASNQIYFIMFAVLSGCCYGLGIYNAQYYGAGRYNELRQVTMLKIYLTLVLTIIILILSQTTPSALISFTTEPTFADKPQQALDANSSPQLARAWFKYFEYRASVLSTQQGVRYFSIVALSYPILAINTSFITTLRETGRPLKALWLSVIALTTNCVANPFLIEPHFLGSFTGIGVQGSAIATSFARVFQLLFLIGLFWIKRYEFIPRNLFKFSRVVVSRALAKAWPILLNEFLWSIGMVVQVKLRAVRGVDALTANAIFSTIISAFFVPLYHGFSAGTSILVGNRLGADKLAEAEFNARQLLLLSVLVGTVLGWILAVVGFFAPDHIFANNTQETFRITHWMLFIYGLMYPLLIFTSTSYAIVRTGGAVFNAFLLDSFYTWIIPVPLLAGLVLGTHLDIVIIVIIAQITDSLKTIWSLIIYRKKRWLKNLTVYDYNKSENAGVNDKVLSLQELSAKAKLVEQAKQEVALENPQNEKN